MIDSASPFILLIFATLIVLTVVGSLFGIYTVEGHSMEPYLSPGRNVIIFKRIPFGSIKRGDILVYKSPFDGKTVIKRCTGLPGDTMTGENGEVIVPEEAFFALGDNLPLSDDSRHYGVVSRKAIKGKVVFPRIGGSLHSE
ncbi:signal peptidase I [Sediminispirochaeta smaragdinae]|jgi:signal peptidase I|uniref:Signal peptidase I n=1 Tax=Sediminispirochaeta smaragdinae (strain DSM 11293 / JCM 15392 / SEBR 4228) TaxID=573413 RepID=E1R4J6_SEDSS|nr:signal peptidase I [Sediminispirochaeta smaragdinae]ADK81737.1 signal peptidase I [Sediminispirochaeta smaragdinae DSM 11293]